MAPGIQVIHPPSLALPASLLWRKRLGIGKVAWVWGSWKLKHRAKEVGEEKKEMGDEMGVKWGQKGGWRSESKGGWRGVKEEMSEGDGRWDESKARSESEGSQRGAKEVREWRSKGGWRAKEVGDEQRRLEMSKGDGRWDENALGNCNACIDAWPFALIVHEVWGSEFNILWYCSELC